MSRLSDSCGKASAANRALRACLQLAALIALAIASSGCSVVKATQQPDRRDLNVLGRGVPRTHVIAELGPPVWSEDRDERTTDVFAFKQGYSKPVKAGRALVHGAADVMTCGLWEVIGVPIETVADGEDVRLEVCYNERREVESVRVFRGEKVVFERNLFTGQLRYPSAAGATESGGQVATAVPAIKDAPAPTAARKPLFGLARAPSKPSEARAADMSTDGTAAGDATTTR